MGQKEKLKAATQRKALPRQTLTKKPDKTPANVSQVRDPMRIFRNDQGELEMSKAGSIRVTRTFLGLSAPIEQDNTLLDNVRLSETAGAIPYARGKCSTPEALNVALESVAALAPRDGMEVMLCSQLVALHSQGMDFLRRGMLAEQTMDGVDRNVNRATKLLRTFATMYACQRSK
jgi:hypothetical protein